MAFNTDQILNENPFWLLQSPFVGIQLLHSQCCWSTSCVKAFIYVQTTNSKCKNINTLATMHWNAYKCGKSFAVILFQIKRISLENVSGRKAMVKFIWMCVLKLQASIVHTPMQQFPSFYYAIQMVFLDCLLISDFAMFSSVVWIVISWPLPLVYSIPHSDTSNAFILFTRCDYYY